MSSHLKQSRLEMKEPQPSPHFLKPSTLQKIGDNRREYKSSLGKNREAHGSGQWERQQAWGKDMSVLPGWLQPMWEEERIQGCLTSHEMGAGCEYHGEGKTSEG